MEQDGTAAAAWGPLWKEGTAWLLAPRASEPCLLLSVTPRDPTPVVSQLVWPALEHWSPPPGSPNSNIPGLTTRIPPKARKFWIRPRMVLTTMAMGCRQEKAQPHSSCPTGDTRATALTTTEKARRTGKYAPRLGTHTPHPPIHILTPTPHTSTPTLPTSTQCCGWSPGPRMPLCPPTRRGWVSPYSLGELARTLSPRATFPTHSDPKKGLQPPHSPTQCCKQQGKPWQVRQVCTHLQEPTWCIRHLHVWLCACM